MPCIALNHVVSGQQRVEWEGEGDVMCDDVLCVCVLCVNVCLCVLYVSEGWCEPSVVCCLSSVVSSVSVSRNLRLVVYVRV